MQITSLLATLLLAAPALVTAAPVTNDGIGISAVTDIFARDATCRPKFSADPATRAKQETAYRHMLELTPQYKQAEASCKSDYLTRFDKKGGDKTAKNKLRDTCIRGLTTLVFLTLCCSCIAADNSNSCVNLRREAAAACKAAGGQSDAGHENAIKVCQSKLAKWRARPAKA